MTESAVPLEVIGEPRASVRATSVSGDAEPLPSRLRSRSTWSRSRIVPPLTTRGVDRAVAVGGHRAAGEGHRRRVLCGDVHLAVAAPAAARPRGRDRDAAGAIIQGVGIRREMPIASTPKPGVPVAVIEPAPVSARAGIGDDARRTGPLVVIVSPAEVVTLEPAPVRIDAVHARRVRRGDRHARARR